MEVSSCHHLRWLWLLFISFALWACTSPKPAEYLPAQSKVLVLGDSISAGYGVGAAQSWVHHLGQKTGWQMINAGVSGDTTADGLARLPSLLDIHQPRAVVVELGGNDMLRQIPDEAMQHNLSQIITTIQNKGMPVLLIAVPQVSLFGAASGNLSDAPVYRQLAKKQQTAILPDSLSQVLSNREWRIDQVHPNEEGHRQLAERLAKTLQTQGWY